MKKTIAIILVFTLIFSMIPQITIPVQAEAAIVTATRTTVLNLTTDDYKTEKGVILSGTVYSNANEKWSYDSDSKILTLFGVNIHNTSTSGNVEGIKVPDGTTIILTSGTKNIVHSGDTTSGNSYALTCLGALTIEGTGSLQAIAGSSSSDSIGIFIPSTIFTTGTLDLSSGSIVATAGKSTGKSFGVYSQGRITISGGSLTATGGTASFDSINSVVSAGVSSSGNITISGGTVTAVGGTALSGKSAGIHTIASESLIDITLSVTAGAVAATGGYSPNSDSYGIFAERAGSGDHTGKVNISGGTITAKGGTSGTRSSIGINGYDGVDINNPGTAIITAVGGKAGTLSAGIHGGYTNIAGGIITAVGGVSVGENGESYGIGGYFFSNRLYGGVVLAQGGHATSSSAIGFEPLLDFENTGMSIISGTDYTSKYNLYANNTINPQYHIYKPASTLYETSVVGDGYSWSSENKTLTLTNCIIDSTTAKALSLPHGAKIILEGINIVHSGDVLENSYAIFTPGDLTIEQASGKTGTLIALSGDAADGNNSYGIFASNETSNGKLNINSGTIISLGGRANNSYGIYSYKAGTISSTTVTAMGGYAGGQSIGIGYKQIGTDTLTISSAQIAAFGGTATQSSCGIEVQGGDGSTSINTGSVLAVGGASVSSAGMNIDGSITVSGSAVVSALGSIGESSYGMMGGTFTNSGGTVISSGNVASDGSSYGLMFYSGKITISGGTTIATGGNSSVDSYGIYSGADKIIISGGTTIASAGTSGTNANSFSLYDDGYNIEIGDPLEILSPTTCGVGIMPGNIRTIMKEKTLDDGTTAYAGDIVAKVTITTPPPTTKCTITWDDQGATTAHSGGSTTIEQGSSINFPTTDPKKTGYIFGGWYTEVNGGGTKIVNYSSAPEQAKVTYYAYWKLQAGVVIKPATTTPTAGTANLITLEVQDFNYSVITSFSGIKVVTISGYGVASDGTSGSFGGTTLTTASATTHSVTFTNGVASANLVLNKAGTQNIKFAVAGVGYSNNIDITPGDNTPATCTITWDSNGGSSVAQTSVNQGAEITLPTSPTKTGYKFDGWWTEANGGSQIVDKSTAPEQPSITYYAKWSAIETVFDSSDDTAPPVQNISILTANGKSDFNGLVNSSKTIDGKTTATLSINQNSFKEYLKNINSSAVVTLSFANSTDVAKGELNGQIVKDMENKDDILVVQTPTESYKLPAKQIDISKISEVMGKDITLSDIKVEVEIMKPSTEIVNIVQEAANKNNFSLVVPAVDFKVSCTYQNKTVEVSSFNSYVERRVNIPAGVDPNRITTGIVVEKDGTTRHVPTAIILENGVYYAVINSLTNSTYSVVWHPANMLDVENHWAKSSINNMASRMVINGVEGGNYEPDRNITRAEFAAIMVRALGLKPGNGANPFSDVDDSNWYAEFIKTATSYNLITGYNTTTYKPEEEITREQAMVIIARAMGITKLGAKISESEIDTILATFTDIGSASSYAKEYIAQCVKTGVVGGRAESIVAPNAYISRAEVAVIVERLLKKSNLID